MSQVLEASGDGSISHPAILKDKVASPAGTTIAGLAELETSGVRGAMIRAVRASARRYRSLQLKPNANACLPICLLKQAKSLLVFAFGTGRHLQKIFRFVLRLYDQRISDSL